MSDRMASSEFLQIQQNHHGASKSRGPVPSRPRLVHECPFKSRVAASDNIRCAQRPRPGILRNFTAWRAIATESPLAPFPPPNSPPSRSYSPIAFNHPDELSANVILGVEREISSLQSFPLSNIHPAAIAEQAGDVQGLMVICERRRVG